MLPGELYLTSIAEIFTAELWDPLAIIKDDKEKWVLRNCPFAKNQPFDKPEMVPATPAGGNSKRVR
jgi:hypothetical protein